MDFTFFTLHQYVKMEQLLVTLYFLFKFVQYKKQYIQYHYKIAVKLSQNNLSI